MSKETIDNSPRQQIPKISPYYGHQHNQVITFTNPDNDFTATFQWDGIKEVYHMYNSGISLNGQESDAIVDKTE